MSEARLRLVVKNSCLNIVAHRLGKFDWVLRARRPHGTDFYGANSILGPVLPSVLLPHLFYEMREL